MIERHQCQEQREPEPAPAGQLQTLQQAQGQVGIGFAPLIKYRKAHQLALIVSLGPKPTLTVWSLQDGQLTRYNFLNETETARVAVAQDVLIMAAEYGYDRDGSGKIDQSDEWTATTPAAPELGRLIAVRVAILVRTSQFERDEVTTVNPRWANGSKEFDLSAVSSTGDTNWKHYRYRVYESVIPLRNTIWGQLP